MSLIPTVYRSTDPGAPVLSGTAGSFAALMDAVLVNGYGTGPDAKPGLGWVRAFSDGHKRAYQNSLAEGGTGMFWRIDDSNAQYVLNSCFHSMSDIDTGIDGFGGGANAWGKSVTANTTSRGWVIVGNSRTVYIFISNGFAANDYGYAGYVVGDYERLNEAFEFNFLVSHSNSETVTSLRNSSYLLANTGTGCYAARRYDGAVVNSPVVTRQAPISGQRSLGSASSGLVYPHPATGGMLLSRALLNVDGVFSGALPGMYAPEHSNILTRFVVFDDLLGIPGKYLTVECTYSATVCQGLLRLDQQWAY